jgi:hypothetical protein
MILVPYFIKRNENWTTLNIFLSSGGRQVWHIESQKDKAILKMLKDNGFPVVKLEKVSELIYAEIDSSIDLSSFYTWEEIDPETSEEDIWRTLTIPVALWTCPVFKEDYCKKVNLPPEIEKLLDKV